MQDLYIFIDQDNLIHEHTAITDRVTAVAYFKERAGEYEDDTMNVYKCNPADNSAYDVTHDIAEAAWFLWQKKNDDADTYIPRAFTQLGYERAEPTSNREHRTYTTVNGHTAA